MLVDTHAHLHHEGLSDRVDQVLENAAAAGVGLIVNVGVDDRDSEQAITIAHKYDNVYATVGLHPHDAKLEQPAIARIRELAGEKKVVAIGECGLDYLKNYSPKEDQHKAFRAQIHIALEHNLPMVWHVRDAFDDFFSIVDEYDRLRGIVHCFTSDRTNMERAVERGFLVAFNGIHTFTKAESQLDAARHCPLEYMVLETDSPFLAPKGRRGRVNEPANVRLVAEFLAELRGEPVEKLAKVTTATAANLLGLEIAK